MLMESNIKALIERYEARIAKETSPQLVRELTVTLNNFKNLTMGKKAIDYSRLYFGVFYWKDENGWMCDLIDEPFTTKKELFFYIKDWRFSQ